jgi:hypothetical protein
MILRPFFSFYGSKWRLAPKYPAPRYDTIIEPFAGSAGYSLRYPDHQVILIERDPQVAAVWRWLIAASPDDILSLPHLRQGDSLDDYEMPQEARWLMGFWVHQGSAKPCKTVTEFGATNGHGGYDRLAMWPPRVSAQLRYIKHWRVIEGDYRSSPDVAATWFIDPPYQVRGKTQYQFNSNAIDFSRLAEWCRSRLGQTMVCENAGATWLPFQPFATGLGLTISGETHYSQEVVWLSETAKQDWRLAA